MQKAICVYCASSNAVAPGFFKVASELGVLIARHDYALVYGGTNVGLMGAVAKGVHQEGGKVIGVLPKPIRELGIAYQLADELIVTGDLRERKAAMEAKSDAFVALPGGFGTLEELLEVITLKQLRLHTKPIILVNTEGFYDPLIALFEHIYEHRFAKPHHRKLYEVVADAAGVFAALKTYQPVEAEPKLF